MSNTKSYKCPYCNEKIKVIHVSIHTYKTLNIETGRLGRKVGFDDFETIGRCPECSELVSIDEIKGVK